MSNPQAFSEPTTTNPAVMDRQHWMAVLARADLDALEAYWQQLAQPPSYRFLRAPEIGLALVRGRAGGTGAAFNLGEVTLTRCVVELATGAQGFGYVRGRSRRHAELAAVFDGLMQEEMQEQMQKNRDGHGPGLIEPLHRRWLQSREYKSRKAAATKVNFMTMVRGS